MLIDVAAGAAILLAAGGIVYLGLAYGVGMWASALLIFSFILSELVARRTGFGFAGFVLTLVAAIACAVLGHLAVLTLAAFDEAPAIARQFFAPLTVGAACACVGALAHRARYHAPFSWIIALGGGLYAIFGALKLGFGNAWQHL